MPLQCLLALPITTYWDLHLRSLLEQLIIYVEQSLHELQPASYYLAVDFNSST